ncbi:hypothetical protein DL767_001304 [Monosporascus sp. MG133]|nr:hypothetical protein DL767_001304 [Monosporascus sp. MG133]
MPFPSPEFPFHPLPLSNVAIPKAPLTEASHAFLSTHTSQATVNHCLRSACFALLLIKRLPNFANLTNPLDTEAIVLSVLLHDMGWATTKSLVSNDTRFEVDGANIARTFLTDTDLDETAWDAHRLQLVWDAIALHTTPSIAVHKEAEVAAAHFGILADFLGPYFTPSGNGKLGAVISVEEYREIVRAFPREGLKDELIQIMCGLCREKPDTTFDNSVSEFGLEFGMDGKGAGKEEFKAEWEVKGHMMPMLLGGLDKCAVIDEES